MTHTSLASWLAYIESQHPAEIELGLARGSAVLARLNLSRPNKQVITVAGTNGKGSTCAMLTQYLCAQGESVGTYTSPHFLHFNERIALNNSPCDDELLCRAFEAIEVAREGVALTYFEFSTLAALWIFEHSGLDYWVLEVGLGGRLDSVNMIDTDVAVVTSIALDHTDWLGDNVDIIAQEKAGIARKDKLLISGVVNPPRTIEITSQRVGALLRQKGQDFSFKTEGTVWSWQGAGVTFDELPIPSLPLQNAATVVAVLVYMGLNPKQDDLKILFQTAQLTGRFQRVSVSPDVYIDVAHNPEAAIELANRVDRFERQPIAVCGMLKDKDIDQVMMHLSNHFSEWFCADLGGPRGAKASKLVEYITQHSRQVTQKAYDYSCVADAFNAAVLKAKEQHRSVVVFGSFLTVSDYLTFTHHNE